MNRNSFATFLAIAGVVGISLLCRTVDTFVSERRAGELVVGLMPVGVGLCIIAAAILATQSRMGALSFLVASFLQLVLWSLRANRAGVLVALVGVVTGGTTVFILFGSGLLERLGSAEQSIDVRRQFYDQVWRMIMTRPWTGFGLGSFELAFPLFHQPPVSVDVVWEKSHSTYLALWADSGLIFGSIPLFIVSCLFVRLVALRISSVSSNTAILAAIGATIVVAIHSLVDFGLEIESVAMLFTAVLAAGVGASSTRTATSAQIKPAVTR